MNNCKLFIVNVLIIQLLHASLGNGQEISPSLKLTFDQAWKVTNQNSHIIKQVQYQQQEKDQAAKAAKGLYMPNVGLTASYMLMSDKIHLDLTPVRDAIIPLYKYGTFTGVPNPDPATNQVLPILPDNLSTQAMHTAGLAKVESGEWDQTIQKEKFGVVAATFQWPIFVGGKIGVANRVAKIEQNEVGEFSRQKMGELMSELAERYYGLCLAKQAVRVRQDVYKGMEQHLRDAEKMQKQGLIANAEVLHAKLYFAQAERELSKAKRTADIVNQALGNTLVLEKDTVIDPLSQLFYLDSIESAGYFKALANKNNPQLLQVESKKLLAEQAYKAEKADYFPAIALQGMYNVVNKDLSPYAPDWVVGIGMKWTLFDGVARSRKVKAAYLKTNQVEEFRQKANADIATMIEKLYNELNMYREQLSELESAQNFAEEYLRVRKKAFNEEMTNATEVVDASLALAGVRIERLQAMYGYDLTLARLLQYAGISEEYLAYSQRKGVKIESYKFEN